ncbi:MAG: hypothetical protein IPH88_16975 [Bacteroidales bacterium]|nr:hypothetical protein [Bacteroidales bacterium]
MPTPVLIVPDTVSSCFGAPVVLCAAGANTYQWSNGDNIACCEFISSGNEDITVIGSNYNGCTTTDTVHIIAQPLLQSIPGPIEGAETVCSGQNSVLYSIPPLSNVTQYAWTLPPGAQGSSKTNFISIDFGTDALSGLISVQAFNNCSSSLITTKTISVSPLPNDSGPISGLTQVSPGQNSIQYQVAPVNNAEFYIWSLPTGWNLVSGQGTK